MDLVDAREGRFRARLRIDLLRGRDQLGARLRERALADGEIRGDRHVDPLFVFEP